MRTVIRDYVYYRPANYYGDWLWLGCTIAKLLAIGLLLAAYL